ncbi:hypothetical protein TNCT_300711 [Trichonephila clavata]|uniref:Uncharacterized protein n=1 Tax=Trichonephila clavata TaxID=2740835 RepID=A0A8X6M2F9_TRICU|nr:hypothetical protein TNCT_300711 [Trichonephila clavata]
MPLSILLEKSENDTMSMTETSKCSATSRSEKSTASLEKCPSSRSRYGHFTLRIAADVECTAVCIASNTCANFPLSY